MDIKTIIEGCKTLPVETGEIYTHCVVDGCLNKNDNFITIGRITLFLCDKHYKEIKEQLKSKA